MSIRKYVLLMGMLLLVGGRYYQTDCSSHANDLALKQLVRVEGKIIKVERKEDYQRLTLLADRTLYQSSETENWQPVADQNQRYLFYLGTNQDARFLETDLPVTFQVGGRLKIEGILQTIEKPRNQGEFNRYNYYRSKKIYYCLKKVQLIEWNRGSPTFINRTRGWFLEQSKELLPATERGLLLSLLIGERDYLDKNMRNNFNRLGIGHVLAISGLHISLLLWLVRWGLTKLPLSFRIQGIILMAVGFFYLALTGYQPSTIRAVGMVAMVEAANWLERPVDQQRSLIMTAYLMLVWHPFYLFNGGFLLSFGSVASLLWIQPFLFENKPKWLQALGVTWSIQLGTLPLLCNLFFHLPLAAFLLNLIFVPGIIYFMGVGFISSFLRRILLPLGRWFVGSAYYIVNWIEGATLYLSQWDWLTLTVRQLSPLEIVFYYLIIGFSLFQKKKRYLLLLIVLAITMIPYRFEPELTMLDVGQAESMVLTYHGKTLVIDTGLSGQTITRNYLWSMGRSQIDLIMITHLDADHFGGVDVLLDNFKVRQLALPVVYQQLAVSGQMSGQSSIYIKNKGHAKKMKRLAEVLEKATEKGVEIIYLEAGQRLIYDDLKITIYHPNRQDNGWSDNDYSLVCGIFYYQTEILLTGDVSQRVEKKLLEEDKLRTYDVLKVAHHGSKYSSDLTFLTKVKPKIALISCGRYNRYGHPAPETLDKFDNAKVPVAITAQEGAIRLKIEKERIRVHYDYQSND